MRKTKIVCTIGPASQSEKVLRGLLDAGMDMARLNFSHGTHESHGQIFRRLRIVAAKAAKPLPILQDLQGPKIRTGLVQGGSATLRPRDSFILTTRKLVGSRSIASTTYADLPRDVKAGDLILVGDGYLRLRVERVSGTEVFSKVVEGGLLKSHMGINLPGVDLTTPSLTRKDRADLAFGLSLGVDYVGMSFVRRAEDVVTLKKAMARFGREVPVIAKLERPEAIANLSSILDRADGVMVARGDLGVEMPLAQVPIYQKEIIKQANQKKRLVITATQMLESMIENSKPTRAEVSDVANAIFDGTDAVMLSGETASGKYPVAAAATMAGIAATAESCPLFQSRFEPGLSPDDPIPDAVAQAAVQAAERTGAKAIVAFSQSGMTALFVSKYRPSTPVIGFTPHDGICRRMGLFWGVLPRVMRPITGTDRLIDEVEKNLLREKRVKKGDRIVVLMGAPIYRRGTTNLLKIVKVGR
jgi:pyruvate kinase